MWVLTSFLDCMGKKLPKAVVTDGDGSMREAIKAVLPSTRHCLCGWHLNKNAMDNVKNSAFLEGFKKAMYSNFTEDEFEEFWGDLVRENCLENNPWVTKTYENKELWATAYLRDDFFGGIRTTSQCESVNKIIKSYVRKKGNIFEFLHNFDEAMRGYRNNELVADFKSRFSSPVLTTHLRCLEREAAEIYTAEIFQEVKEEIMKGVALSVKEKEVIGDLRKMKLTKYLEEGVYEILYDESISAIQCSCRKFESRGVPCSQNV
jgi:hypothetical protein